MAGRANNFYFEARPMQAASKRAARPGACAPLRAARVLAGVRVKVTNGVMTPRGWARGWAPVQLQDAADAEALHLHLAQLSDTRRAGAPCAAGLGGEDAAVAARAQRGICTLGFRF